MFLMCIRKAALVAVVALSLGVLSTAARAGDGNIAQQSSGKGVTPPATQAQQAPKGKNDFAPNSKGCNKGKCGPSKQKSFNNKSGNKAGVNSGTNSGTNSGANVVSGNQ